MTTLYVYISSTCETCGRAIELVAKVRQLRPRYPIKLINLDEDAVVRPAYVFGTPTYCLGDRIISLGNPGLYDLLNVLDREANKP